jgi:L-asparaginase/Glu-tRNA(Gln) amidotransferase subunit D
VKIFAAVIAGEMNTFAQLRQAARGFSRRRKSLLVVYVAEYQVRIDSILILTTGGTIDKHYFDSLSRYQIVDTVLRKLLAIARVTHHYSVEEILRKDSLDLTEDDRACLVEHVRRAEASHIIITHGTDTMTLTASALSVIPDKTIVLTGAIAPAVQRKRRRF